MKPRERLTLAWFFLSFILLTSLVGIGLYVYVQLNPEQRTQLVNLLYPYRYHLAVFFFLLPGLIIFGAKWVIEQFWLPLAQLTEEAQVSVSALRFPLSTLFFIVRLVFNSTYHHGFDHS